VTGYGVSDGDMPNFPWQGRQDASAIEDAALAAMLSGPDVPEDLAAGLQPAADVLAALRARPSGDELAGEAFAMAEFRNRVGVPDPVRRTRPRRRPALLTSLMSAKVAVAAAAVAITIGGVATAAYAGALPAPAQRLAHDVIGAPADRSVSHSSGHGTAADRTGSRRPFRHHFGWHGCWTPNFHRSWMPSPHPSWTATPHPSWTPAPHPSWTPKPHPVCTPAPHPSGTPHPARTPKPHPSFMPGKFRHHHFRHQHHRYPGHRPGPRPTGSPAPRPTSMPSPQPSGQH
jgi:cell division septation protein DedD